MTKEDKKKYLEKVLRDQERDNLKYKLNIKYFKKHVIPQLEMDRKKKKQGKMEVDNAKNKIPEWERAIEMNKKFMDLVKEEIAYIK